MRSHHGSIARPQRVEVEDLLKAGRAACAGRHLVARARHRHGRDRSRSCQIEAPPSVASGLQRIGRGGHQANAVSEGVIFPKFRGDLVACAAVAKAMHDGAVEATRYPRNPLDIVAQQIVAMASMDDWDVDALFATIRARGAVRRAEPHGVRRRARHAVGPLSVRRVRRAAAARHLGSRRRNGRRRAKARSASRSPTAARSPTAGCSACFCSAPQPGAARVGELDEEMVFESRVGETFVLGASSWRIEEITHDRVLVVARAR